MLTIDELTVVVRSSWPLWIIWFDQGNIFKLIMSRNYWKYHVDCLMQKRRNPLLTHWGYISVPLSHRCRSYGPHYTCWWPATENRWAWSITQKQIYMQYATCHMHIIRDEKNMRWTSITMTGEIFLLNPPNSIEVNGEPYSHYGINYTVFLGTHLEIYVLDHTPYDIRLRDEWILPP